MQPNFFDIKCDIPKLKGDNYKFWNEKILLHLGWIDIHYAIRKDEPPPLATTSSQAEITLFDRWE